MTKLNRYSFLMLTMGLGFCENAFSALRQYDPHGTPTSVPVRLVDSDYELKNTYYIFKVLGDLGKKSEIDLSEFFDIPGLQTRYYNLWVLLIGIDETVASVPSFTKPEDIRHVRDEDLFQSRTDDPSMLVEKLNRIIEAWQSGETIEEVSGEELKLFNN